VYLGVDPESAGSWGTHSGEAGQESGFQHRFLHHVGGPKGPGPGGMALQAWRKW
jgi:hypothetical protein